MTHHHKLEKKTLYFNCDTCQTTKILNRIITQYFKYIAEGRQHKLSADHKMTLAKNNTENLKFLKDTKHQFKY